MTASVISISTLVASGAYFPRAGRCVDPKFVILVKFCSRNGTQAYSEMLQN